MSLQDQLKGALKEARAVGGSIDKLRSFIEGRSRQEIVRALNHSYDEGIGSGLSGIFNTLRRDPAGVSFSVEVLRFMCDINHPRAVQELAGTLEKHKHIDSDNLAWLVKMMSEGETAHLVNVTNKSVAQQLADIKPDSKFVDVVTQLSRDNPVLQELGKISSVKDRIVEFAQREGNSGYASDPILREIAAVRRPGVFGNRGGQSTTLDKLDEIVSNASQQQGARPGD